MKATGMKITNFHYSNTAFDKGEFVEYPKWVHMAGFPPAIAHNAEQEATLLARTEAPERIKGTLKLSISKDA